MVSHKDSDGAQLALMLSQIILRSACTRVDTQCDHTFSVDFAIAVAELWVRQCSMLSPICDNQPHLQHQEPAFIGLSVSALDNAGAGANHSSDQQGGRTSRRAQQGACCCQGSPRQPGFQLSSIEQNKAAGAARAPRGMLSSFKQSSMIIVAR